LREYDNHYNGDFARNKQGKSCGRPIFSSGAKRKSFHLSQEKAAHILGISRRTVINYEKGENPFR